MAKLGLQPGSMNSKLGHRYNCSHTCVSNHPSADFAIHYNTAKGQPDVMLDIVCILLLVCNWPIPFTDFCTCDMPVKCKNGVLTTWNELLRKTLRVYPHPNDHSLGNRASSSFLWMSCRSGKGKRSETELSTLHSQKQACHISYITNSLP